MAENQNELGLQPLDGILNKLNLSNKSLVDASEEQLSFKVLQKGRKGRKLTRNAQFKILKALNKTSGKEFKLKDLFTY